MLRKAILVCLIALLCSGFAMAQNTKTDYPDGNIPGPDDFVLGGAGMTCYGGPPISIPDNTPDTGVTSTIVIDCPSNVLGGLEVLVQVNHTWVGDLEVTITKVGGGSAVILDRPGLAPPLPPPGSCCGCSGDNIDAIFSDNGDHAAEAQCDNGPAISGVVTAGDPNDPGLMTATFDGEDFCGTWELRVTDGAGADTGQLLDWCVSKREGGGDGPGDTGVPASSTWGIALLGLLMAGSLYVFLRRRAEA